MKNVQSALCVSTTAHDRRNQRVYLVWLAAWMMSWLGMLFLMRLDVMATGVVASAAALVSGGLGVATCFAYRRFLREADELRRKIELDAIATAMGVGIVTGLTYWLLGHTGAVTTVDPLVVPAIMLFTQGIGVRIGTRRYA